jgi:serine/threonine-protein kinase 11
MAEPQTANPTFIDDTTRRKSTRSSLPTIDIETIMRKSSDPDNLVPRKLGIESESALDYYDMRQSMISLALEKRQRQYQSTPRAFTYDKPQRGSASQLIKGSLESQKKGSGHTKSSSAASQVSQEVISKQLAESMNSSKTHRSRKSDDVVGGEDRIVSTSYTGSLEDEPMGTLASDEQQPKQEALRLKRLSILKEESLSRPTSAVYDENGHPVISNLHTPSQNSFASPTTESDQASAGGPMGYFEDIQFIQYTSQDIQFEHRKKAAKVIGQYVMGDVLGEGSYGKVKEAYSIETLKRAAVKIMKQAKLKKIPNGEANVRREIALLKQLHHKNIIELLDVVYKTEKNKIYVIFEFCAATVSDLLARAPGQKFPMSQAQRYFKQMVKGLQYLHSKSIVHRDIKPGNLLVTVDDQIKITDFGVAENISRYSPSDTMTSSSGSPAFQPPEIAAGKDSFSAFKVDIWAAGVTLYHFISGKYPFDGDSMFALFDNIAKCEFKMPEEADDTLADLLRCILEKDAGRRYSLDQIRAHLWVQLDIPRHPKEISVTPPLDNDSGVHSSPIPEDQPAQPPTHSHLSNPNYAYDTTLIPYLEPMFDDLPTRYRRSSVVEALMIEKFRQRNARSDMAGKFLRRLSFRGDIDVGIYN